jgi:hypothetical protein
MGSLPPAVLSGWERIATDASPSSRFLYNSYAREFARYNLSLVARYRALAIDFPPARTRAPPAEGFSKPTSKRASADVHYGANGEPFSIASTQFVIRA